MLRTQPYTLLLAFLLAGQVHSDSGNVRTVFSSGAQRVALIELFTSEGCSSCPPADRWLSGLKTDPDLWKDFVPVAFHVDYWDYIGWKDRFSRPEYSDRQRRYAEEGGARVVYTPGFFYQGKDWRGWRGAKSAQVDKVRIGELSVLIDDDGAAIHFNSLDPGLKRLNAHVALLGMNLETAVRAGENRGRKLKHDFVALNVVSVPLDKSASGYTAITELPEVALDVQDIALAVWVSEVGAQMPIQSVGGYL
ncbi:MAG: DUF1223 domain-containing protein [Candidatus Tectomicrobia bacterium]|nr:DUF1223 domain-containing protein [Candidatus Tectomicrobia bacterium]